eukprot:jgi/Mesvir1/3165/Mv16331-RA.4
MDFYDAMETDDMEVQYTHAGSASMQYEHASYGKPQTTLETHNIPLISHVHSRQRRQEREISKAQLQAAVKYGTKEPAHPGRNGKPRWRFTHNGVVFITDDTCQNEVTCWRLDERSQREEEEGAAFMDIGGGVSSHTVLTIDTSSSMGKGDVGGYPTRLAAVYECLARDLVEPQLASASATDVVSVIEMTSDAQVVLRRAPLDADLVATLRQRASVKPRGHGHYLPSLDAALELMAEDAGHSTQLFLVFLSDGAPSDHSDMVCSHGVNVWAACPSGDVSMEHGGRLQLMTCGAGVSTCRQEIRRRVAEECLQRVRRMGDLFGRDRMSILTVAFGSAVEDDLQVLRRMAACLPRHSCARGGHVALRPALISLASVLTTVRRVDASLGLTSRDLLHEVEDPAHHPHHRFRMIQRDDDWSIYGPAVFVRKLRYAPNTASGIEFVTTPLAEGANGLAVRSRKFVDGAERACFRAAEVFYLEDRGMGELAAGVGLRLVAKESLFLEQLEESFYQRAAAIQAEVGRLADLFNGLVDALHGAEPAMHISFVETAIYELLDEKVKGRRRWILAEPELEGHYTKWNNNAGGVGPEDHLRANYFVRLVQPKLGDSLSHAHGLLKKAAPTFQSDAAGLLSQLGQSEVTGSLSLDIDDVPQCFSHFTWCVTDRKLLTCDLQGVWNSMDGFTLTDPAVHCSASSEASPRLNQCLGTDKGQEGIDSFFGSHRCSALCTLLGLHA